MLDTEIRHAWAHETFGHAQLGHLKRTRRLVGMAARLAAQPAGTVTSTFRESAAREGAFRWLSSAEVNSDGVVDALGRAAFGRASGRVYCAIDGASLRLTDRAGSRDIGNIGAWRYNARGLQAMTSVLMDELGTPLGVPGVRFWARTERSRGYKGRPQKTMTSEMRHGVELLRDIEKRRAAHASDVRVHYVLDRGFDAWAILREARDLGIDMTVRSRGDRGVFRFPGEKRRLLRPSVERAAALGTVSVEVPARNGREARSAVLQLRAIRVAVELSLSRRRREPMQITAVLAREVGRKREGGLDWLLLTTDSVASLGDAQRVLDGYTMRWRIEELHRAWKSGWCNVERTQLRGRDAIYKWATLHLAVAVRAIHLSKRARTEPDAPASEEFSRHEIDVALLYEKKLTELRPGDTPTLRVMVNLVAVIGGYTGKSSGGPPGPTVIGRGLDKLATLAEGAALAEGPLHRKK
jgi:nucleotide-binding universal stress UspA family protein